MAKYLGAREAFLDSNAAELFPAADAGDLATYAQTYREVSSPILTDIADALEEEGIAQSEEAAARNAEAADEASSAITMLLVTALASIVVATVLTFLVVRRITRTVRSVQRSAEAMAAGDLTVATGVTSQDELGQMAAALDSAQVSLREVLSSVVVVGRRGGGVVGGAVGVLGADLGVGRGDLGAVRCRGVGARRRSRGTCRPSPPARSRWAPPSGRSPRTRRRPARSRPRP